MPRETRHSATGRTIKVSTRHSAVKVYVPRKLREHLETTKTRSGTKLVKRPR